jgi:hemerythrin
MALLQWRSQYSVGIEAVDHEHRELIDLINRLHEAASARGSKDEVIAFFGDLYRGISAHFALEERFMRDRKYDHLDEHKNNHEQLLDDLRDIMDGFEQSGSLDDPLLAQTLDTWFSRHFETHDALLHKALGAHP